jgi:hypothetical protein
MLASDSANVGIFAPPWRAWQTKRIKALSTQTRVSA